jgi:glycerophosphoryl diester phosphodiesterase
MGMNTLVIASECAAGLFPKNTLAGFQHCQNIGVDGIEFDVHLSRDGHVVVQHDYLLNTPVTRDTAGNWLAAPGPGMGEMTLAEIKQYDVGRYSPSARENLEYPDYQPIDGTRIPTLVEFIEQVQLKQTGRPKLWLELKTDPFNRTQSADPKALLDTVLQNLTDADLLRNTVLLAFEWDVLLRAQSLCPEIETDFLTINRNYLAHSYRKLENINPDDLYGKGFTEHPNLSFAERIKNAGGTWWGPLAMDVSEGDVAAAQKLGLKVNLWGVPSTNEGMRVNLNKHPDAITLSCPDKLMALLAPS